MNKYALIIEEYACWGCKTCEVACKQEYNPVQSDNGVKYLSVWPDGPKLMNGKLDFIWRVNVCKHCAEPVCAKACPEDAITKDPKTGIVLSDKEKCNGCHAVVGKSGTEKQETSPCKIGVSGTQQCPGICQSCCQREISRSPATHQGDESLPIHLREDLSSPL